MSSEYLTDKNKELNASSHLKIEFGVEKIFCIKKDHFFQWYKVK